MTKKEFKRAMLCGLGRCIPELRETGDKEKYRNLVLWASEESSTEHKRNSSVKKKRLTRHASSYILIKVAVKRKYFTRGGVHGKDCKAGFII